MVSEKWVWISFCATGELHTLDHQKKKRNPWILEHLMRQRCFFWRAAEAPSDFSTWGKSRCLKRRPSQIFFSGMAASCGQRKNRPWGEAPPPPRSPLSPRLFRRYHCTPADHSLISCTCQEGLSSKTAACVLLICWLQIMNFKWRLTA